MKEISYVLAMLIEIVKVAERRDQILFTDFVCFETYFVGKRLKMNFRQ